MFLKTLGLRIIVRQLGLCPALAVLALGSSELHAAELLLDCWEGEDQALFGGGLPWGALATGAGLACLG